MRFLALFSVVSTFVAPVVLAASIPVSIQPNYTTVTRDLRHVVLLEPGADKASVLKKACEISGVEGGLNVTDEWSTLVNGFAGYFNNETLYAFETIPEVQSIEEEQIAHSDATQEKAPWGLARINSKRRLGVSDKSLGYTFNYDSNAGKGVDIYIVDSGIRITHNEFGGRAHWGDTFGPLADEDGNGHGTHCAGTAAGKTFGVAKRAKVYAVRVLDDTGHGPTGEIVNGLTWVLEAVKKSKRPSVVSMSIGFVPPSPMADAAVRSLVNYGVHVVVSAGNDNWDATKQSPARVKEVITVGASTIQDERWVDSNYGSLVDVFAPGHNVKSAGRSSDTATAFKSGTSMATPHVAGLIAALISIHGNETPAKMALRIKNMSLKGILNPYTLPEGTQNRVIVNNYKMQTMTYST